MTMWLGIVLGAIILAGAWFTASSADYTGLLGCFLPPDPNESDPTSADDESSPRARHHLTDDRFPNKFLRTEE
jgi:hypothetical protein